MTALRRPFRKTCRVRSLLRHWPALRLAPRSLPRLALPALLAALLSSPAQAACFSTSKPTLPTPARIAATLTNGEAGRRMADAVRSGRLEAVEALARAQPALLSTRTALPGGVRPSNGNTADLLTIAVANCDPVMVGALLELGADPNGALPGLALTYAVLADDPVMAVMLLQAGANPDASMPDTSPPMREALYFERADAVAILARFGADVNRSDPFGGTPLDAALLFGDWASAKALMDAGANPWQVANKGLLPAFTLNGASRLNRRDRAIREALLARARAQAPIWPPPDPAEVARNVLQGGWPTPAMRQAGFVLTEGALRSIRRMGG